MSTYTCMHVWPKRDMDNLGQPGQPGQPGRTSPSAKLDYQLDCLYILRHSGGTADSTQVPSRTLCNAAQFQWLGEGL